MFSKIRSHLKGRKWIPFLLFYLYLSCTFLEASLINPDLAPQLLGHTNYGTGYEDFARGRICFNEKKWEKAIYFFTQAIEKSPKSYFKCSNYLDHEAYRHVCEDYAKSHLF